MLRKGNSSSTNKKKVAQEGPTDKILIIRLQWVMYIQLRRKILYKVNKSDNIQNQQPKYEYASGNDNVNKEGGTSRVTSVAMAFRSASTCFSSAPASVFANLTRVM